MTVCQENGKRVSERNIRNEQRSEVAQFYYRLGSIDEDNKIAVEITTGPPLNPRERLRWPRPQRLPVQTP